MFADKETIGETVGEFTWFSKCDWFIETSLGNFHWKDPGKGGDNTLTLFNGSYQDFCTKVNMAHGHDNGSRPIMCQCGRDFKLIIPQKA